jgi:hypothetical protein
MMGLQINIRGHIGELDATLSCAANNGDGLGGNGCNTKVQKVPGMRCSFLSWNVRASCPELCCLRGSVPGLPFGDDAKPNAFRKGQETRRWGSSRQGQDVTCMVASGSDGTGLGAPHPAVGQPKQSTMACIIVITDERQA